MRTPKKGDRCEFAVFNSETYRKTRVCEVRHLSGTPPGLLMPVKQGREAILVCNAHAQELMGTHDGSPLASRAVKKQKKGLKDAVQEVMF